ncbi:hypothetical protein ACHAXS_006590 [Conticribra weissflogii]
MANFSISSQSSLSPIARNEIRSYRSGVTPGSDDDGDDGDPPCSPFGSVSREDHRLFGLLVVTSVDTVGRISSSEFCRRTHCVRNRGLVRIRIKPFIPSFFIAIAAIFLFPSLTLCVTESDSKKIASEDVDLPGDRTNLVDNKSQNHRGGDIKVDEVAVFSGSNSLLDNSFPTSNSCDYDCCSTLINFVEKPDFLRTSPYQSSQLRGNTRILQSANDDSTTPCLANSTSEEEESGGSGIPISVQYILIVILVMFSALFSGLTLGLMSLDPSGLEIVMANSDDPRMARAAKAIYPVRLNGNLLLCTLLLGNVGVNSLLSIIMADLTSGLVGFLVSTTVIVLFGEIAPQAFCSRYALQVGEKTVPIVKVVMVLLYPITKPLSLVLNKLLGHEIGTTYSTSEMAKLIEIHVQRGHFQRDTGAAMTGALRYRSVSVREAMTPLINTFMLSADERLGFDTVAKIFKTGYSRIPVYEVSKSNVIGLLFVKDLIFLDPEDEIPVKNFVQIFGRGLHIVWPDDKLGEVLKLLKSGRSHMALVRDVNDGDGTMDPYYEIKGIITLEDIIEIIIGDEIVDETDELVDVNNPESLVDRIGIGEYIDGAVRKRDDEDDQFDAQIVAGGVASDRFSTRGVDWEARLRLLDERLVDEHLSPDEVRAVAAHLKMNYPKAVELVSDRQLKELLSSVPVTEIPPAKSCAMVDGEGDGEENGVPTDRSELIYERGVPSDFCTLVLSGKITVMSGADRFRSDVSNWGVLATRALTEAVYTPDFSAWVVPNPNGTGGCRCVKLDKKAFFGAVDNTALEKTGHDVTAIAMERKHDDTIVCKSSNGKPILMTLRSISNSLGQTNGDSEKQCQTIPEGDLPPSSEPEASRNVHVSTDTPPPHTHQLETETDTEPVSPTYVRTRDQKEIQSRRSKLLKAFLHSKSKLGAEE